MNKKLKIESIVSWNKQFLDIIGSSPIYLDALKATRGEWDNEPNEVYFVYKKYDCLILRRPYGNLCGYVRVPKVHPYYKKNYNECHIIVHCGLTFGGALHQDNEDLFWLGFDCAHLHLDIIPKHTSSLPLCFGDTPTYKNIEFVKKECMSMVDQLIEVKHEK